MGLQSSNAEPYSETYSFLFSVSTFGQKRRSKKGPVQRMKLKFLYTYLMRNKDTENHKNTHYTRIKCILDGFEKQYIPLLIFVCMHVQTHGQLNPPMPEGGCRVSCHRGWRCTVLAMYLSMDRVSVRPFMAVSLGLK